MVTGSGVVGFRGVEQEGQVIGLVDVIAAARVAVVVETERVHGDNQVLLLDLGGRDVERGAAGVAEAGPSVDRTALAVGNITAMSR